MPASTPSKMKNPKNIDEASQIASTFQFTPKQFDLLKKYGAKVSTSGNEMYIPELVYVDMNKNVADSGFKQEFKDTVPSSDAYLVSQVLTALKKVLGTQGTANIKDNKYYVLKGHMTKNGNFNFPNPYREKEKKKKIEEGSDHEVAMAINSLEAMAKAIIELKQKLGNQERNIPGWIQDHIAKAENYIEQAAQGFHELNEAWTDEDTKTIQDIMYDYYKRLDKAKGKMESKDKYDKILRLISRSDFEEADILLKKYETSSPPSKFVSPSPVSTLYPQPAEIDEEKDPLDVVVAEKKGKDRDNDGDVDSEDWKIGRDIAIKAQMAKKK
jgi:hypothetical protein